MDGIIPYVKIRKQGPLSDEDWATLQNMVETEVEAEIGGIDFDSFAKTDGYYDSLTAGNAEQLVSSVYIDDEVPYNYRTSGGSIEIGDREIDTIVGGSVGWNQLVPTTSRDYTNTATENTNSINFFFRLNASPYTSFFNRQTNPSTLGNFAFMAKATATGNAQIIHNGSRTQMKFADNLSVINGHLYLGRLNFTGTDLTIVGGLVVKDIQLIDLTQLFGSSVADAIYAMEQATAGSGVAFFKNLFGEEYFPYNSGSLESVQTSAHKMTGFNQWDEEWEKGKINSDGSVVSDNTRIVSKNFIPLLPNTTYCMSFPSQYERGRAAIYDENYNKVAYYGDFPSSVTSADGRKRGTFTTPANGYYLKINPATDYGTTYNHDICINLHWDGERDGEYELYEEWSYPLDPDLVLRGVPKWENGQLKYDGDIYYPNGTVERRYAEVDLGSLTWNGNASTGKFYATVPSYPWTDTNEMRCSCYQFDGPGNSAIGYYDKNKAFRYYWVSQGTQGSEIYILDESEYASIDAFKTAVTGQKLIVPLATPTTESADPYVNPQKVDDFGTEEYVDERTVPIPVGHMTKYMPNLRAKLEMAPNSPSADGDYIVHRENGENTYIAIGLTETIQNIISRLEALEGGGE